MLSKSEKAQLIEIEKCERTARRSKLEEALIKRKQEVEKPFSEKIKKLEDERTKVLIDAGLYYISSGCGRTHPDLEEYTLETNRRIKTILRE